MKKLICLILLLIAMPAEAQTFWGNAKDDIANGVPDKVNHYEFNRKIGTVLKFTPVYYGIQPAAFALVWTGGFIKELIDIPRPNHKFELKDIAANTKGLVDGINGNNFMLEQAYLSALKDGNKVIYENKKALELIEERLKALEGENHGQ